jgi:uncharacterized protein YdbL (DUF1318 family)
MRTVFLRFAFMLAALVLFAGAVRADALDDAQAAGLVGETPMGYVATVAGDPAPDIAALVKTINAKRQAAYAQIAADTGTSIEAVAAVTAEKLYQDAAPGEYLLVNGQWVRK